MGNGIPNKSDIKLLVLTLFSFIILFIIQLNNYLLFHVMAEIFSIVIAYSVFIIVWNGKKYLRDGYLLLLGLSYFFIGLIDILHTLGYNGMAIFPDYDFYANQLWIASRAMEALTLFVGAFFINREKSLSVQKVLAIYFVITVLLLYSIFFSDIFPACFVEGQGQTTFKIYSEHAINVILVSSVLLLVRKRKAFPSDTFRLIVVSISFTILSELAFTFYVSNYGFSNMLGHYAKIISFYFIYRAIVQKNITDPYDSIFRELNLQKEKLLKASKVKRKLFSVISHDLKGPIGGISGVSEILVNDYENISEDDKQEMLVEINRSVKNIYTMLENLLSWAKLEIEGNKLKPVRILLKSFVTESVSELNPLFKLKGVELRTDLENISNHEISADPDSLNVVLRNILLNALKFSSSGSAVTVRTECREDFCSISVVDHGVGMNFKPEMLTTEVNESSRGTGNEKGTGLGLFIINKYTLENGGKIDIESSPGKGTTVTLEFPCS